jgi:hypothetical protein
MEGIEGERRWGNVANVLHKSNQNCYYESPLYNEYILTKNLQKQPTIMKGNMEVPQNIKTELLCDLPIYPQEKKLVSQGNICTPIFFAALIIASEIVKQPVITNR